MRLPLVLANLLLAAPAFALDGQVQIHDPSTIAFCDGKYYTYGTGGTPLVSDDGWTWRSGTRAARTGAAPDVIHIGDRYFMYISGVTMISSKSLDPQSPDYKWEDGGRIAGSEGPEDFINPIDPAPSSTQPQAGSGSRTAPIMATPVWSSSTPTPASAFTPISRRKTSASIWKLPR